MNLRYALREWQVKALEAWRFQGRKGIVEVVTGGGKTVLAESCMVDTLKEYPSLRIIIVVPTVALLDQWCVSLQEELGLDPEEISVFSGKRDAEIKRVNVMVINTARRKAPELAREGQFMLIVDECHRAGSAKNALALKGQYVATLGLSATPERQYDEQLDAAIIPALGPIVYQYDIVQARQDGIVTPFQLCNVEVALLPDEQAKYDRLTRRISQKFHGNGERGTADKDVPDDIAQLMRLRSRVSAMATMRIPVTVHLTERHRGQRLMIFHEDIDSIHRIVCILNSRGHRVSEYHTRVGDVMRRSNLRLYRQGIYDVLASCHALDEGINIPETEVAVIVSATATVRQRIQRLGRVLRPSKGKDKATIYTLFATPAEQSRLLDEAIALEGTADVKWTKAGVSSGSNLGQQ